MGNLLYQYSIQTREQYLIDFQVLQNLHTDIFILASDLSSPNQNYHTVHFTSIRTSYTFTPVSNLRPVLVSPTLSFFYQPPPLLLNIKMGFSDLFKSSSSKTPKEKEPKYRSYGLTQAEVQARTQDNKVLRDALIPSEAALKITPVKAFVAGGLIGLALGDEECCC